MNRATAGDPGLPRHAAPARALAVVAVAVAMLVAAWGLVMFAVTSPSVPVAGAAALDAALSRLASGAAAVLLAWWSLGLLACVVVAVRRPARPTISTRLAGSLPRSVRLAATTALGIALTTGTALPAALASAPTMPATLSAQPIVSQSPAAGGVVDPAWSPPGGLTAPELVPVAGSAAAGVEAVTLAPGWAPGRPETVRPAARIGLLVQQPRPEGETSAGAVVVHRGDTLWDICARHLPDEATDADIAAEWPRWYEANKAVLGDDPDRLVPGQTLRAPAVPHGAPGQL